MFFIKTRKFHNLYCYATTICPDQNLSYTNLIYTLIILKSVEGQRGSKLDSKKRWEDITVRTMFGTSKLWPLSSLWILVPYATSWRNEGLDKQSRKWSTLTASKRASGDLWWINELPRLSLESLLPCLVDASLASLRTEKKRDDAGCSSCCACVFPRLLASWQRRGGQFDLSDRVATTMTTPEKASSKRYVSEFRLLLFYFI